MRDTLDVAVNRDGLHTLEVPERFETSGPFVVELANHGDPTHVHLNLDEQLSRVARVEATNYYVQADSRRAVEVETRDPEEWGGDVVRGKLKVVAAHGQETHWVDVVLDRTTEKGPVEVDPDLAVPQQDSSTEEEVELLRTVPVAFLGGVAIVLAIGAVFASPGVNYGLGALAILAAALSAVAAYYLLG